jgi:glycosyltransferase involved in cell wall biosynthesis
VKIAIVTNQVPFVQGGAEFLVENFKKKLIEYGHEAQVIKLPFSWYPQDRIIDSMMAAKLTRIENTDKVIAMKFPAYYVEHPNIQIWLIHQFRQCYDLWGTEYQFLSNDNKGQKIRDCIIHADNEFFRSQTAPIYTISPVVSKRLKKYNGVDSQYMCAPLNNEEIFYFKEYGDFIFYPSRVNHSKRQHVAVEAMRYVRSDVKLVLAGKGDTKKDEEYIKELIDKYELSLKVEYINRFISEQEKADLFASCLAAVYIPVQEDSYGYVTLEAFKSQKTVITFTDSGGTDIVIKDGYTGVITDPDPKELAGAMDALYNNRKRARELSINAPALLDKLGINWETIIKRLV